uniref:Uncharacterized protein n=1 Tax=uncultured marine thaumarchaeote KM3_55_F05 TaxID=1456198 RepID=A0A075HB06_9ARCH|nr:hypothetical protein [uncultured marine thaumarchaeote KM3_55_F05]
MGADDKDLERLTAKKLQELKRRAVALENAAKVSSSATPTERTPRDVLVRRLYDRGLEVLETAETFYPTQTALVVKKLAELVNKGDIKERISGGELLSLFRSIGLRIRVPTSINIEKHGKSVPLGDRLKITD